MNPLTGAGLRGNILAALLKAATKIFDDDGDGEVTYQARQNQGPFLQCYPSSSSSVCIFPVSILVVPKILAYSCVVGIGMLEQNILPMILLWIRSYPAHFFS